MKYKVVVYSESVFGFLKLGGAKVNPEKFSVFLNKNAKDGLLQKLFFCKWDKYQTTLGRVSNKLLGKN